MKNTSRALLPIAGHGITLNKITEVVAGRMRQRYLDLRNNYSKHTRKSFFISKDMLEKMVLLLNAELAIDQAAKDPTDPDKLSKLTDGVRIYLGADLSSTSPLFNLQLIFVSTKDDGKDVSNLKSGRYHKDNYIHDIEDPLFKLKGYEEPYFEGDCEGTLLYTITGQSAGCEIQSPHAIERHVAEAMVAEFSKDHKIVTEGEWFDLGFWEALNKIPKISGVRVYLACHTAGSDSPGMDAFVLTKTTLIDDDHVDDFTCHDDIFKIYKELYERKYEPNPFVQDNGELCPTHCD